MVELVHRSPVGLGVDPVLVRRHPELVVEQGRAHRLAHHRDALLRELGAHRVHGAELAVALGLGLGRRQERGGLRDAGIGVEGRGLGRRRREHRLPRHRRAAVGVLGEDVVEDRRAGAREADDEHRPHDPLGRDRRGTACGRSRSSGGSPCGAAPRSDAISSPIAFSRASAASESRNRVSPSTNWPSREPRSPRSSSPPVRTARLREHGVDVERRRGGGHGSESHRSGVRHTVRRDQGTT